MQKVYQFYLKNQSRYNNNIYPFAGKDYIQIQKGLLVLHYLLLHGSDQVLTDAKVHQPEISTLTDFRNTQAQPDNGGLGNIF